MKGEALTADPKNQRQQHPTCNYAAELTSCVGTHGVHEDEVGGVFLQRHLGRKTPCHREGGDAAGSDKGVNLTLSDHSHQFAEEQTSYGINHEGQQALGQDHERIQV